MSRRARRRAREAGQYRRRATPAAKTARATLDTTRKALAQQLGFGALLALLALVGTIVLTGTWGPFIVLAVVAGGALIVWARTHQVVADAVLADDDRMLQTLGYALLGLAVGFSLIAAVVLTVA